MGKLCQVKIIRIDGRVEHHEIPKGILSRKVHELIGAETFDCVALKQGKVMIVDDSGAIDGKPINPEGTKIYQEKCGYITPNSIHGDVAICTDSDFA